MKTRKGGQGSIDQFDSIHNILTAAETAIRLYSPQTHILSTYLNVISVGSFGLFADGEGLWGHEAKDISSNSSSSNIAMFTNLPKLLGRFWSYPSQICSAAKAMIRVKSAVQRSCHDAQANWRITWSKPPRSGSWISDSSIPLGINICNLLDVISRL